MEVFMMRGANVDLESQLRFGVPTRNDCQPFEQPQLGYYPVMCLPQYGSVEQHLRDEEQPRRGISTGLLSSRRFLYREELLLEEILQSECQHERFLSACANGDCEIIQLFSNFAGDLPITEDVFQAGVYSAISYDQVEDLKKMMESFSVFASRLNLSDYNGPQNLDHLLRSF
jgi:hypothetical protein